MNVPPLIATVMVAKMATLHELQTIYGTQDAYDLLEVINITRYNKNLAEAD